MTYSSKEMKFVVVVVSDAHWQKGPNFQKKVEHALMQIQGSGLTII